MRRIFGFPACLGTSVLALLLAGGCGQSEGERCQINSDCSSGLYCSEGSSGNGTCKPNVGSTTDTGVTPDVPSASGPEVEPTIDAEPALPPDASVSIDTTVVDAGATDTM
jgi:hypothetical protein